MIKQSLKLLILTILGVVLIPSMAQAKSEEIYAVECKINYFGEDIQAFYVKDELFIKLRDFLDFFDIQNDSFVKYDGKSNSVILNIQPEILKIQDSIKIKPVKQDGKTKLFKSSHKLIVFSEENKDNGKKHEVKGMQMYLINGANYVAIKEISEERIYNSKHE